MAHDLPYYEYHGHRYPRLTRILSILRDPAIERWRKRVGEETAETTSREATAAGTAGHALIAQTLLTGKLSTLPPHASDRLAGGWKAWCKWYALQPPMTPLSIETPYVSPLLGYGATPDFVEATPQRITDWKFASAIRPSYWIQLNAEVPLVFGQETALRIVRLDWKLEDFEEMTKPYAPAIAQTFLTLKQVYLDWYGHEMQVQPQEEVDA